MTLAGGRPGVTEERGSVSPGRPVLQRLTLGRLRAPRPKINGWLAGRGPRARLVLRKAPRLAPPVHLGEALHLSKA